MNRESKNVSICTPPLPGREHINRPYDHYLAQDYTTGFNPLPPTPSSILTLQVWSKQNINDTQSIRSSFYTIARPSAGQFARVKEVLVEGLGSNLSSGKVSTVQSLHCSFHLWSAKRTTKHHRIVLDGEYSFSIVIYYKNIIFACISFPKSVQLVKSGSTQK